MDLVKSLYEPRIAAERADFARLPALETVLHPDIEPDRLLLFFILFCALGVQMTKPVDGWIRRAGERCSKVGLAGLGRALVAHARHEAGHDALMVADTEKLVAFWNARHERKLSAAELLGAPASDGVREYVRVHEEVIASEAPYGQLAIELEIERLSVDHGPRVLGHCAKILGPDVLKGLSFLEEHVALDVGHTAFNESQLDRLLAERPDSLDPLVRSGAAALRAYARFFTDCIERADTLRRHHS